MNRSLKLSILLALALGSTQAAAVELGQAHVKSALGQPLLVDIPVTQATPGELQSLSAQLASNDAFAKVGGQRPTVPLQFNVVDENGHKVIRVTSSASVDDPYLDLLVEVHSNTGSTVREFAILLDPANKVAQEASSSAPARHRVPAAAASAPSEAASAPRHAPSHNATAEVKNGQFGPVEKGQTLSHIATEVAPSGVNTDQMMLALKAANPDAFYRDNINALKAGAILRVPSRDDALTTAIAQAAATVREQNSDWRNGAVSAPVAVAAGGTRENTSVAPTANSNADRLALVPPGSEGQTAGGTNGKANAAVRQQLQRSQEMLASLQQQSNDLKSRLKDLEDINTKNQRLLSLKDDEIADLQKKLAQARKTAGMPPAPPVATAPAAAVAAAPKTTPAAPASTPAATPAPALASASTAATKPATTPAAAATASHAAVTTPLNGAAKPAAHPVHRAPASHAAEEQPWYMQPWAWAAGGGVVVLLLLGLLARRGKSGTKPAKVEPIKGSLADRFGTVDADEDGHPMSGSDPDQDELLDQLAEQPDDIGLHLELVSLYYTRRDVEHFEAAAEAMHAHITDPNEPEWQDVVHMGRDLAPGHPLFVESTAAGQDDHPAPHHFDLDSYASRSESEPVPAKNPSAQPAKVSEYHFDFDLTAHHPDALARAEAAATTQQVQEPEPVSTWKFDDADADAAAAPETHADHGAFEELHDDPVDTKLDLARAYLDMGDPDGARAMLEEVLHEGTQMQKDVARQLMEKIH